MCHVHVDTNTIFFVITYKFESYMDGVAYNKEEGSFNGTKRLSSEISAA